VHLQIDEIAWIRQRALGRVTALLVFQKIGESVAVGIAASSLIEIAELLYFPIVRQAVGIRVDLADCKHDAVTRNAAHRHYYWTSARKRRNRTDD